VLEPEWRGQLGPEPQQERRRELELLQEWWGQAQWQGALPREQPLPGPQELARQEQQRELPQGQRLPAEKVPVPSYLPQISSRSAGGIG
jgi:hypothetical protein